VTANERQTLTGLNQTLVAQPRAALENTGKTETKKQLAELGVGLLEKICNGVGWTCTHFVPVIHALNFKGDS